MHLLAIGLSKHRGGQTYVAPFGIKPEEAWPSCPHCIDAYLAKPTNVTVSVMSHSSLTSSKFIGQRRNKFISWEILQFRYRSSAVCDIALDSLAFNVIFFDVPSKIVKIDKKYTSRLITSFKYSRSEKVLSCKISKKLVLHAVLISLFFLFLFFLDYLFWQFISQLQQMHLRDFGFSFVPLNFSSKKMVRCFAAVLNLEIVWSFSRRKMFIMSELHIRPKFHTKKINLDFTKLKLVK